MPLFNWFSKPKKELEKKSVGSCFPIGLFDVLQRTEGNSGVAASVAISYYRQTQPLADAIDTISRECASVSPAVFDTSKGEYLVDHSVLDLLNSPNKDSTFSEFVTRFMSYYLITGNTYVVAQGLINQPAKEIIVIPSQSVTVIESKIDMFPQGYNYDSINQVVNFVRVEDPKRIRFINGEGRELWHTKTFNPSEDNSFLMGLSPITPISKEIEQYIESSIHNLSLLQRGARPSLAVMYNNILTEDQFRRAQNQVDNLYGGAENTGRPMIIEGDVKEVKDISINLKDMDFVELKKSVTNAIYTTLGVPLALISTETMTHGNIEAASLNLYHNAVIPLLNRMYQELTRLLMPRYGVSSKDLQITFDSSTIPAIQSSKIEQTLKVSQANVLTINEIRSSIGYEPLEDGNVILAPANLVPVATDEFTEDEPETPSTTRKEFISLMRCQLDVEGNQKFDEKVIQGLANQYGLK